MWVTSQICKFPKLQPLNLDKFLFQIKNVKMDL